jgi:hypothetical protein
MCKFITTLMLLFVVLVSVAPSADARGGRSNDECPIGSKDPDCK